MPLVLGQLLCECAWRATAVLARAAIFRAANSVRQDSISCVARACKSWYDVVDKRRRAKMFGAEESVLFKRSWRYYE